MAHKKSTALGIGPRRGLTCMIHATILHGNNSRAYSQACTGKLNPADPRFVLVSTIVCEEPRLMQGGDLTDAARRRVSKLHR